MKIAVWPNYMWLWDENLDRLFDDEPFWPDDYMLIKVPEHILEADDPDGAVDDWLSETKPQG